jgi:hypothetical protein
MTTRVLRPKPRESENCHADANTFAAKQILNALREKFAVPRVEHCSECGSTLVQRQARLSIYGSDEGVTISVGFCEWCEGASPRGPVQ